MKLLRFGEKGRERPGLQLADGDLRDLSGLIDDVAGDALAPAALAALSGRDLRALPRVSGRPRLGPCVGRVGKLIAIGLNYRDHAAETGSALPSEPLIFMKATSAICGPDDPLEIPPGSTHTDWEVELAVVIGRRAKRVGRAEALAHVAGYCAHNDVSERHWQKDRGGQWVKGKSHDSFAPLGPWLVTPDEVPDPQGLRLWLEVDGERRQDGHTKDMVFGVAEIVAYVSEFMTLEAGDVISTGTPAGVGAGRVPPLFLRPGQELTLEVEGLGRQRHRTVGG